MASTLAQWRSLGSKEVLRRSSQALSVIGGRAYVFGGELRPREPRDGAVHMVDLQGVLLKSYLPTENELTTMFLLCRHNVIELSVRHAGTQCTCRHCYHHCWIQHLHLLGQRRHCHDSH